MTDTDTSEFRSDAPEGSGNGGTPRMDSLPLLPLTQGVVLPQMVVTIALETDEAKRAGAAAEHAGRPHRARAARRRPLRAASEPIAQIENAGRAAQRHARARRPRRRAAARVGTGRTGADGRAARARSSRSTEPEPTARARELAKEYRAVVEAHPRAARRCAASPTCSRASTTPASSPTCAAYCARPHDGAARRAAGDDRRRGAPRARARLGARDAGRPRAARTRSAPRSPTALDEQQREMLLRRQLDAIRKELGEGDDDDVAEYRARVAELDLPDGVRTAVDKELDRLERMGAQNPEQAWVRNWLDAVLDLPWGDVRHRRARRSRRARGGARRRPRGSRRREGPHPRVPGRARAAARARTWARSSGRGSGAILALVGPPGVGKTSLGESVARALGSSVRARRRRRCARRGRDPRSPAHLRRVRVPVASCGR